jgi:hypothetical protein
MVMENLVVFLEVARVAIGYCGAGLQASSGEITLKVTIVHAY